MQTSRAYVHERISGTLSYLDTGGTQTIYEFTTTQKKLIDSIWLDLTNMTKNGTIKLSYKIDGTTYREYCSIPFTVASDSDGMHIDVAFAVSSAFKLEYTEETDEGAARNLPYEILYIITE